MAHENQQQRDATRPALLTNRAGAATLLGVSGSSIDRMVRLGHLERVSFGPRCSRYKIADIERLAETGVSGAGLEQRVREAASR